MEQKKYVFHLLGWNQNESPIPSMVRADNEKEAYIEANEIVNKEYWSITKVELGR